MRKEAQPKGPTYARLYGLAKKKGITWKDVSIRQLMIGIKIEKEHTSDPRVALQIALDHLAEHPNYYTALRKMEKELTAQEEKKAADQSLKSALVLSVLYKHGALSKKAVGSILHAKQTIPFTTPRVTSTVEGTETPELMHRLLAASSPSSRAVPLARVRGRMKGAAQ